jgi:hypothetical protein
MTTKDIKNEGAVCTKAGISLGGLLGEPSRRVRGMGNQGIARRENVPAEVLKFPL